MDDAPKNDLDKKVVREEVIIEMSQLRKVYV